MILSRVGDSCKCKCACRADSTVPLCCAFQQRPCQCPPRVTHPQSDPDLVRALNEVRLGQMSRTTQMLLEEVKRPLPDDGITATHLYPRRHDVSVVRHGQYDMVLLQAVRVV